VSFMRRSNDHHYYLRESEASTLDPVNSQGEDQDLEPLTALPIDLKDLDQPKLGNGLEALTEMDKQWQRTLQRIKKKTSPPRVTDKQ
jgi:hypothetical protein